MAGLKLEVFESAEEQGRQSMVVLDQGALEETRLAAYDQGYAAGWEDAVAAQADEQVNLRADLARNLQALSFTYQEARAHLLGSLGPFVQDMVARLLPEVAREALAPVVLETLMPLADQACEAPVTIVVAPAARPPVEALLAEATGLPVTLVEEPTLGEGQAYLRLETAEVVVDLDRAVAEITAAVRDFFALSGKENRHG
jgi:flagellar assembly protein FliH